MIKKGICFIVYTSCIFMIWIVACTIDLKHWLIHLFSDGSLVLLRYIVELLESFQLLLQLPCDRFCTLFPVDVMHLCWVGLQVKQFPDPLLVEMHQLVPLHFHAVVRVHAVKSGKLVIMVVERLAPVARCLAGLDQLFKRLPLHITRYFDATKVEQGRSEVDVL